MTAKLSMITPLKNIGVRAFGAQAAPKQTVTTPHQRLPNEDQKSTVLENGLTLYSQENHSPVSRVVIVTKAGSRYEDGSNLGLTHILRNAAGLTTKNSSTFAITKNVEWVGGNIYASTTRDHTIYTLECNRDYVASAIKFLNDMVFDPAFKRWELEDSMPRIQRDLLALKQNQGAQLIEALHQASFRGGLANSLYANLSNAGKIKQEQLLEFTRNHITGPRTVVSALGVDHERLVYVYKKLTKLRNTSVDESTPSKFNANGGEVRIEHSGPISMAALAMESCGLANPKDALTMEVLKHVLGISKARVPFSDLQATRLGKAVLATKPSNPFSIGAFVSNYSDTGLFGVAMAASNKEIGTVTKAAVSAVRDLGKGNVSEQEVSAAKQKVKYAIGKRMTKDTKVATLTALQHLTQSSLQNYEDMEKMIDSIGAQEVTSVAQKMSKVKPSMAVVGKLYDAPHLDELLQ